MAASVEFIFDFASPNAYLAYRVLPKILARTGAKMTVTPALLGGLFKATNNQSPMAAFGEVRGKLAYEQLETRRFIAFHRLTRFSMNPHFPINTLLIMRGLVAAEMSCLGDAYREAVLSAMWEQGLKMDDRQVVEAVLAKAGLGGAALIECAADPEVKQALVANTEHAVARGVFGIPTFFVGKEMFFGKERLGQVEAELAAEAG